MNDKFSLRDYPLKAASLYVSALSFILENTTVAIAASGQLSAFKPPVQIPDAIIEVGIRYNF